MPIRAPWPPASESAFGASPGAASRARESLYDDTRIGLLADALFDAVFVHVDGRIVEVNRAFETTFGYTAEEALDLTVFDIIAAEHHDLLVERVQTRERGPLRAGRRHQERRGPPHGGLRPDDPVPGRDGARGRRSTTSPTGGSPRSRWESSRSSTPPT